MKISDGEEYSIPIVTYITFTRLKMLVVERNNILAFKMLRRTFDLLTIFKARIVEFIIKSLDFVQL